MKHWNSLPHSQEPATCPYPKPAQPSPYPHIPLLGDPFQYYPPIYTYLFQVVSFPQFSPLSPVWTFCSPPNLMLHPTLLDLITQIISGEQYRSLRSSLCSLLYSPVIMFLLGPNSLLSTLFSNPFSLYSSLNVSDQVSHPYKTTVNLMVTELNPYPANVENMVSS